MPKKNPGAAPAAPPPEPDEDISHPSPSMNPDETFPGQVTGADLGDEPEEISRDLFEDEEIVGLEEEADYLTALYYGPQGTGKTTAILRILNHEPVGNVIVCNAEGGMKMRALASQGVDTSRIRVWPKQGVRPTFDGLERLVFKVDADLAKARANGQPKPWCAFDLDSVTELVKLMLDNIGEDGMAPQREKERKAKEAGVALPVNRAARSRFKAERDDYGLVSGQMRSILRKLRYMDLHFLMTALVRRDEDADTGATMYGPATPPALQQDLLGYADVVIRTEVRTNEKGETEYVGYTRPDANHHAKDRYNALPAEVLNPTVDRVLGYISGDVVDSTSPAEAPPVVEAAEESTDPVEEPAEKPKPARRSRARASAAKIDPRFTVHAQLTEPITAASGDDDNPPF